MFPQFLSIPFWDFSEFPRNSNFRNSNFHKSNYTSFLADKASSSINDALHKELWAVGIFAAICHRQQQLFVVVQNEVLIYNIQQSSGVTQRKCSLTVAYIQMQPSP